MSDTSNGAEFSGQDLMGNRFLLSDVSDLTFTDIHTHCQTFGIIFRNKVLQNNFNQKILLIQVAHPISYFSIRKKLD